MPGNSLYKPQNWDWVDFYEDQRGAAEFDIYVNSVYLLFSQMKPGSFFDISKNVKHENRDLFIKLCCTFIDETRYVPLHPDSYYEFNPDYTILKNVYL